MPKKQTLTDQSVRNFPAPASGTTMYWDDAIRGFGLRISAGGTKTFMVLIESGRRQSLGHYPHLSLAVARAEAKRVLAEKTLGKIRPAHMAFDDAKAEYLKECKTRVKPRTLGDYTRLLNRHYRFGRKSVAAINPHDLAALLKKLNHAPAERHHAYTAGRAFFRYCVRSHIIEQNPMERIAVLPPNNSRERVLTEPELAKVLKQALAGRSTFDAIVSLLLLTGQRRSEIAALEWAWIDRSEATITLPPQITKNSREHTFPIGQLTLDVLERIPIQSQSQYLFPAQSIRSNTTTVFNGWGKPKERFDRTLAIAPWRLHDLRRTLRTLWAEHGINDSVAERYINHISGVQKGV
ncbi:MAG TPA: tyrosine-type recombinase/integrase, partial [Rhizomicrobium sp.]